ncbi:MAG: hypothetical protein OHK0048_12100 [Rhodoferax sp.]
MTLFCTRYVSTLRRLALCAALWAWGCAWADDYAEVSQLIRANQFAPALTKAEQYLVSKPGDPQMRFLKGVIQRSMGKTAEAISTFTKLTQDYPELPEPYNNLAVLYAAQGQFDLARGALEMAIRTNPSYATAHENLGDVYARLASQAYNKALQLDGNNAAVPPKLALIREIFKPNLANPRAPASAPAAAASAATVSRPNPPEAAKPATSAAPAASAQGAREPQAVAANGTRAAIKNEPPQTAQGADREVESAVQDWAKAWSERDVAAYLRAYAPEFQTPRGLSRRAWEQERVARIRGKSSISVQVSELEVKTQGDQATARFRQTYQADTLSVVSRKTLKFVRHGGRWLIVRESTG